MSAQFGDDASSLGRPRAFEAIVYGGLVVGVLDGLAATTQSGLRGVRPVRLFQFVASGLLGAASYNGGWASFLLGVLIHFFIAFVAAAVYYRASLSFPVLIRRAVMCGIVYGVAVYFFMSRVVVPLSATRKSPFSLTQMLIGLMIHILFIGLPIALLARSSARANEKLTEQKTAFAPAMFLKRHKVKVIFALGLLFIFVVSGYLLRTTSSSNG